MAGRRTLTIVKPDAFANGKAGLILALLEQSGFTVQAARVMHLTTSQAADFYAVHRERGFFGELVEFMSSGPCMPLVLERDDAVATLRTVIGATDPAEAAEGTVRLAACQRNVCRREDRRRITTRMSRAMASSIRRRVSS